MVSRKRHVWNWLRQNFLRVLFAYVTARFVTRAVANAVVNGLGVDVSNFWIYAALNAAFQALVFVFALNVVLNRRTSLSLALILWVVYVAMVMGSLVIAFLTPVPPQVTLVNLVALPIVLSLVGAFWTESTGPEPPNDKKHSD